MDLQSVPFNVAYVFDDIDNICWAWEKLYTDVLDRHAPLRSIKCRTETGKSKFITADIRKAIRKRNASKRKFNKTKKSQDWESYRVMRNGVVILASFVETPRKFIIAELSIRKLGSSSVLIIP